jgi:hypothetical protein
MRHGNAVHKAIFTGENFLQTGVTVVQRADTTQLLWRLEKPRNQADQE